jgi:hypothetical protein
VKRRRASTARWYDGHVLALLDARMHDGSRHFGELPQRVLWYAMRDHVLRLPGATLTAFVCDGVTEAWIDFAYEGYEFSINDQLGAYWFFVRDPTCPETLLRAVLEHFVDIERR